LVVIEHSSTMFSLKETSPQEDEFARMKKLLSAKTEKLGKMEIMQAYLEMGIQKVRPLTLTTSPNSF